MAPARENRKARASERAAGDRDTSGSSEESSGGPIPDLLRRAVGLGLSGFFLTESAVRRALGDTVPKDWVDFMVEQSERTRTELLERVSWEIGRSAENIDFAAVAEKLLEGRALEIEATIRLGPRDSSRSSELRVTLSNADRDADDGGTDGGP